MSQQYTLVPTTEHEPDHSSDLNDARRVTIDDSDSDDDNIATTTLASLPSASPPPSQLTLTLIRQGEPNRSVDCSPDWSVLTLKQRAFPAEVADNKLIRVIYLGRVLLDEQRLADTGIEDGHCLHVLVTDKLPPIAGSPAPASHTPNTYQLSSTSAPASPASPYRHYPQYIHTASGQAVLHPLYHASLAADPSTDPSAVALDPSALPTTASLASTGTTRDFLVGYVLGFFLGFLACLLLWSTHSSLKQRMGIVCGMMTNILLGGWVQKERQDAGGGGGGGRGGAGVSDGLSGRGGGGVSDSVGLGGEVNGMP